MAILSCEKSGKPSVDTTGSDSSASEDRRILDDGAVDGSAWTLAEFSDFFDEDITIERVKKTFGQSPLVLSNDDRKTFVYEVASDRMFENGSRIHTIRINFQGDKFLNAELGFTGICD